MRRVLIVEDEVDIAEVVSEVLTDAGYEVRTANDGREGLAALKQERPDLLITDVMMPVMGGEELLRAIREDPTLRDLRIVVMSAGQQGRMLTPPGGRFLPKPFDLDALMSAVQEVLGEGGGEGR